MDTKDLTSTDIAQTTSTPTKAAQAPQAGGPDMDVQRLQAERRELARDFVTLKHTIAQLRSERDRLAVENRDLKMRLSAIEVDYANLFSYVEGTQGKA